jgi:hypothetical protein
MYNNEQYSDVKITLDDDTCIYVHAMWLATCSEYFRVMLDAPMQESQTRVIDMHGYDPNHVRVCVLSMYDPDTAYKQIEELVGTDADEFAHMLYLSLYGGFTRVQHLMENICLRLFATVWEHKYSATNILALLLEGPGQKKIEIGTRILDWCYEACKNTALDDNARKVLNLVLALDLKDMTKLSRLRISAYSGYAIFKIWVHWYEFRGKNAGADFDRIVTKGIINIKSWKEIPDDMLAYIHRIRGTVTYNFILMGDNTLKKRLRTHTQL